MKYHRNKSDFNVTIKHTGRCNNCYISYRGKSICAFGSSLPSKDVDFLRESAEATINSIICEVNSVYANLANKIDEDLPCRKTA